MTPTERAEAEAARRNQMRLTALKERGAFAIAAAQVNIRSRMKDPESVRFGRTWAGGDSMSVGCGYVNAKNSFGGYGGEELFVGNGELAILESEVPKLSGADRRIARALLAKCDTAVTIR